MSLLPMYIDRKFASYKSHGNLRKYHYKDRFHQGCYLAVYTLYHAITTFLDREEIHLKTMWGC